MTLWRRPAQGFNSHRPVFRHSGQLDGAVRRQHYAGVEADFNKLPTRLTQWCQVTILSRDAQSIYEFLVQKRWSIAILADDKKFRKLLQSISLQDLLLLVDFVKENGRHAVVVPLYSQWIDANTGRSPLVFAAWFNLGVELSGAEETDNAITAYKNALALKPDFHLAAVNLGLRYEAAGQAEAALEIWQKALQPNDARVALLNHRGRLLETLKRYDEAAATLYESLLACPKQPDALQHWVYSRQRMCDWPIYQDRRVPGLSAQDVIDATGPFSILAAVDDIEVQNRQVERWIAKKAPPAQPRLSPACGYGHDRIRVGYMSSDYCAHPISYLVGELFERHDRSRFEVYGYCSTTEDGSAIRKRIVAAFDRFVPVAPLSDEQLAQRVRQDEIDILVDLNGLTLGTRLFAMRARPAPVQLSYLGYIGSLPLPELDYILCDEFVIPRDRAHHYQPSPLYLPGNYQVNDTKLPVGPTPERASVGLPEGRFVYCCFSNNYKITEEIFDAWMVILGRVPNSVLWLLADNPWARANMIGRAAARGIDSGRLIFAGRVGAAEYLGRLPLADLFLDTFPYNAGTTASDALRMGLPLVTVAGSSFVARMAGSLLHSVGLEWGIAGEIPAYIEKAVEVGLDPARYRAVRQAVSGDAWRRSIGNIEAFVPRLEAVYQAIVKRPPARV